MPLTIGWSETLPGIRSTSGQSVQSISVESLMAEWGIASIQLKTLAHLRTNLGS